MRIFRSILLALLLALPAGNVSAQTDSIPEGPERILSFHSEIDIREDGSIEVSETIDVLARGIDIQRGIIREVPTIYETGGRRVLVPMEVLSVQRNGADENYMKYALDNGIGLRIGNASYYLPEGVHTYEIRYSMQRQIGRFEDWDELYWNVNGNAWQFRIDRVSCLVNLPAPVAPDKVRTKAYTGYFGSQGDDYRAEVREDGSAYFETTRQMRMYEGLTVVVGFPKDVIAPPTAGQMFAWWMESNGAWAVALLLVLLLLAYYYGSWLKVGRDPREGLVLHEERPLAGLSASRLRFIWKLDSDRTLVTAMMLELAQLGHLKVRRGKGGKWTLLSTGRDRGNLNNEERAFLDTIFRSNSKSFELDSENASVVQSASRKVEEALSKELHHIYYEMNAAQRQTGILLSVGAFFLYVILGSSGLFFFHTGDFFGFLFALLAMNILFYTLMPSYTELGRAVLDRIEGFRLAMTGGEDSFGRYQHADEVMQEKYLPYAVALGVNTAWVLKLREALAMQDRKPEQPAWMSGRSRGYMSGNEFDYILFSNSMPRHLASQYRKASIPPPPPPSSGSSGGGWGGGSTSSGSWGSSSGSGFSSSSGSSGGGGGGGGGRGW